MLSKKAYLNMNSSEPPALSMMPRLILSNAPLKRRIISLMMSITTRKAQASDTVLTVMLASGHCAALGTMDRKTL